MLRTAMAMALGLALLGAQAKAAEGDLDTDRSATPESATDADKSASADKPAAKTLGKQATVANQMALYDQQASAMADLAIERSQDPKVLQYARQVKTAHQQNLTALRSWADQKKAEIAAISLMVPPRGTGGAGMTDDEKKRLDDQLAKYEESFREEAREAQDEVFELARADDATFDAKFLSMIQEVHRDQIADAKDAQQAYSADTAFAGLMSSAQAVFAQLDATAGQIEGSSGSMRQEQPIEESPQPSPGE
jgi:predicted outer membrane protein